MIAGSGTTARADGASDAKDLFERARALRASGDCAGAAPLFRKAYEVYPSGLGSLRNLAECEQALSHWASARRAWLDLKRGLVVETSKKYEGWEKDATAAADSLAPKVARLTIHLVGDGSKDAKVTLNDQPVDAALIDTALERDPGAYVVKAQVQDGPTAERKSLPRRRRIKDVELSVALPAKKKVDERRPNPPTQRPSGPTANTVVGWIGVSLGAAALVGAGISLGVRQSALDSVNSHCQSPYTNCPPSLEPTVSRGQLASTLVTALGIGGAVVLGVGIVLVVTSPKEPARAVTLSFDGRSASARWSF